MRVLLSAVLLAPVAALAASAFDGTWKMRLDSLEVMGKPDVFSLSAGEYTCSSCSPPLNVKADGKEHKVSGHAYYDTALVRVISPTEVEMVSSKDGKEYARQHMSVSADGATLTARFTSHNGTQAMTGTIIEKRVAAGPPGSHAISGSWQATPGLQSGNDALRIIEFAMTPEGFRMQQNGQSYDAKFDGKEYPVVGDRGGTSVTVRKIDANTVEEIDHRQGKVVDEVHLAAAADGKVVHVEDKDLAHGQTVTYTLERQ